MVNDGRRNWALCSAIHKALESVEEGRGTDGDGMVGMRMLEIGSGSGLLSIFASKLSNIARLRVDACERDEVMQRVAEANIVSNRCPQGMVILIPHSHHHH